MLSRYIRDTNTIGNVRETSFRVGGPVKDHRPSVRRYKDFPIWQLSEDREMVSVKSVDQELARNLETVVACARL